MAQDRIESLAIPPAWNEVWICPWPNGHIQAIGTDAAGRRQYLYHLDWRRQRDVAKHERVLELAGVLPRCRRTAGACLHAEGLGRDRVLAAAFRLLDLGAFRIGSESYAASNDTYGLATLRREHLHVAGRTATFRYPAKGSQERTQQIVDAGLAKVLAELLQRDTSGGELLAWADGAGAWHDLHSADINEYVHGLTRGDFTAKDFRTWNATVLMAQLLALTGVARTLTSRKHAVLECYRGVADYLGNTVSVARGSYVDPRVVELYQDGVILPERALPRSRRELPVHGQVERAVLRMLNSPTRIAA
jgi:DNA topoisomerase IB